MEDGKYITFQNELERRYNALTTVAYSFVSIYYVDLLDDVYTMYRYPVGYNGKYHKSGVWSEAQKLYVDEDVHQDDKARYMRITEREKILAKLKKESSFSFIFKDIRNGGKMLEMRYTKVTGAAPGNVVVTYQDVTETVMERRTIKKKEAYIKSIAQEKDAILKADLNSDELEFIYVCKNVLKKYKNFPNIKTYSELIDRLKNVVSKADFAVVKEDLSVKNIKKELSGKEAFFYEYKRSIDNDVDYYRMKMVRTGKSEKEFSVIISIECITEEMNERLQKEERDIAQRKFIEGLASDFLLVSKVSLDENKCEHVYMDSSAWKEHIMDDCKDGDSYEEVLEKVVSRLIPESEADEAREMLKISNLKRVLGEKKAFFLNTRAYDAEGEICFRQIKGTRLPDWDKKHEVVLGINDTDDMIKRELEYKEALEMARATAEAASNSKTVFLSNMSHDIRTPMNAIIGYTGLAENAADDPDKVRKYLSKITTASNYLLGIINDILDMSRIEVGKLALEESETNIIDLVREINTIMIGQINAKDQKLCVECINVKSENIICDRLRLKRVIMNLLSNATKFTPNGGEIHFTVKEVRSDEEKADFEIAVKDNGCGMSPKFLERLFEPFETERTNTIAGTQGTGLGLTIAHSFVEMMNGTIDVKSKQNVGTEFTIDLSFKKAHQEKQKNKMEDEALQIQKMLFGKKILIVEDNEMNREIAKELLEEVGMIIDEAEDGSYAVDKLKKASADTYDAVLMDVQMPIMDGYKATRSIRNLENKDVASIPIIAMTANAFEEDRQAAFEAGMNDHLSKPLNVDKLMEILVKFVGKKRETENG